MAGSIRWPRSGMVDLGAVRVRDGRGIGVAEYGDPQGVPLFWLPGTPHSRFSSPNSKVAEEKGIRLLVAERPGMGISEPQPGRRIADYPRDLADVADALGVGEFYLAGTSGGGPYIAACIGELGPRVRATAFVSCIGPVTRESLRGMPWRRRTAFAMLKISPRATKGLISLWADPTRDPERFYREMTAGFPPSDRAVLGRPGVFAAQAASVREAVRQGLDGLVLELALAARPWGFELSEIGPGRVSVWHGVDDTSTPIDMGRELAAVTGAQAHFIEGAGHFLHHDYFGEIIDELLR